MTKTITFNQLNPHNYKLLFELAQAAQKVIGSGVYLNGVQSKAFTQEWAIYCDKTYCILTASGLDAIKLVLQAWNIIHIYDSVLVPAWGCVQTLLAVEQVGAVPVPYMTENVKVIIPVHLYGELNTIEYPEGVRILEDACQAHGLKGIGQTAVYSFYPTKNLGALGDGGAIVTNDKELYLKISEMIPHSAKRLDEIQCAFLRVRLNYLNEWNAIRKRNAKLYLDGLENVSIPPHQKSVWHQFIIRYDRRDWLKAELLKRGIETMIHYSENPYRQLGYDYDLPEADRMANEVLSLPVAPHLNENDINYVIEVINEIIK